MKLKLTKKAIDGLGKTQNAHGERYYDTEIPGFGLAAYPTGRKSFFLEYGSRESRRRMSLGRYGAMTPEDARRKAQELLAQVIGGSDPLDERAARSEAERNRPTFAGWVDDYLERMAAHKKHIRDDIRYLKEAKERWKGRFLETITTEEVERAFHDKAKEVSKVTANRFLASIRACLQDAWRKDRIAHNPAMRVRQFPENPPRERVLSDEELGKVMIAIDALEDVHARAALVLLVQTGARLSEVLHARWEDMDLDRRIWRIPSPKAGRPQFVPLPDEAVAMLKNLPRASDYVVAGRPKKSETDADRPRADLKRPWAAVLERAGVTGVHIHDLRRTFGLHIARKAGLHIASKLLRHSDIRVTERHYAPLGFEELRAALDRREADVVTIREKQAGSGKKHKR